MRILMLSWEYPPHVVGGLGAHVAELVPALARMGVEIHLVTPRWKGGDLEETVTGEKMATKRAPKPLRISLATSSCATVYRSQIPRHLTNDFFVDAQETNVNLEKQAELLWRKLGGFDLIHVHDWLAGFAGVNLKRVHKTPLLATIHATERGRGRGSLGGETSQAINNTEWWLTYEAWRVICTSQFMASEAKNYFQTPPDKIDIIPNGVDAAPFDALDRSSLKQFRAKWIGETNSSEETGDARMVFFVGRLVHEKGAHLLVEAAPRVLEEFPRTKFIIAGTGMVRESLRKRVAAMGIAEHVNVAGFIPDADRNKLLKIADVAVFPSLYEPFGIVALEAMAAQCPVVVSTVGGLAEVVAHEDTGVTVYPDSVESLAWGILRTLSDPVSAKRRAEKAYRMVKEEYNWDRIAVRTAELYTRIVEERKKATW
jgi:glycosyltransferase involved in cell wall biosynthesis